MVSKQAEQHSHFSYGLCPHSIFFCQEGAGHFLKETLQCFFVLFTWRVQLNVSQLLYDRLASPLGFSYLLVLIYIIWLWAPTGGCLLSNFVYILAYLLPQIKAVFVMIVMSGKKRIQFLQWHPQWFYFQFNLSFILKLLSLLFYYSYSIHLIQSCVYWLLLILSVFS